MEILSISDIALFTRAEILVSAKPRNNIKHISTDTRDIKKGELFLALVGEHFDGHNFIKTAVKKGATALVVSASTWKTLPLSPKDYEGIWVLGVKDTLKAYQDIARSYLKRLSVTKIAITGTSGKTGTKELINSILSIRYNTVATKGNFNNQIGVPKTVFDIEEKHSVAIIELASGKRGDIKKLSYIVKPDYGIITNIGLAHSEFIGGLDDIASEKKEIFSFLGKGYDNKNETDSETKEGRAILDEEDGYFPFLSEGLSNVLSFSFVRNPLFKVKKQLGIEGFVLEYNGEECHFRIGGEHNLINLHFAIVVAKELGLSSGEIAKGINAAAPSSMRGEASEDGKYTVINDCYNANPVSMRAGLKFLVSLKKGASKRSFAILGDMLELGDNTNEYHSDIGFFFVGLSEIDYLITFGSLARFIGEAAIRAGHNKDRVFILTDKEELLLKLKSLLKDGDIVYFKASRAMYLEEIAISLMKC